MRDWITIPKGLIETNTIDISIIAISLINEKPYGTQTNMNKLDTQIQIGVKISESIYKYKTFHTKKIFLNIFVMD